MTAIAMTAELCAYGFLAGFFHRITEKLFSGRSILAVYAALIVRCVHVALRSRRSFDLLLGCGVAALLGIQTFMIVGGVIKMIPLTGVTMPFISYGGSSLVSCMAMIGIVHGIAGRAQREMSEDLFGMED